MYKKAGTNGDAEGSVALVGGTSRLFQRFSIQRMLGRGDFGAVWLAHDERLDRLVALKLVPELVWLDPSALGELKRVASKSLLLRHPNIVHLLDFVEDERSAAIAMEFVDGSDLSEVRAEKRAKCFAVSELAPWVTSLCDALAYAHDSVGVVHGNLKPTNLMVNKGFELKVTGFGVAGSRNAALSGLIAPDCETIFYRSPQQLAGGQPSPTDDIYAVGAVLYELLSGQAPFFGDDVAAQVREVTAPSVAERRQHLGIAGEAVPRHWEEAIAACLAKNPKDRPQSLVDLARRLQLGGTIRLSAATQESKMRALLQALTQARMVGGTAGLVALIAAGVIALRSSRDHTAIREVLQTANPDGFAMEMLFPTPATGANDSGVGSKSSSSAANTIARKGALQLTTSPGGGSFAIYFGVVTDSASADASPLRRGTAPETVGGLLPGRYTIFFNQENQREERVEITLEPGETREITHNFSRNDQSHE